MELDLYYYNTNPNSNPTNSNNSTNKTISIFVFESGSITIAGSNSYDEVLEAYDFVGKFIYENYNKLLTKIITPQIIVQLIKKMK